MTGVSHPHPVNGGRWYRPARRTAVSAALTATVADSCPRSSIRPATGDSASGTLIRSAAAAGAGAVMTTLPS
jgi:hypothetical protein